MSADSEIESIVFLRLRSNQRTGSKARCHLFTHGPRADVAKRLTLLMEPWGHVSPDTDHWMPDGFVAVDEAQLGTSIHLIPSDNQREELLTCGSPSGKTPIRQIGTLRAGARLTKNRACFSWRPRLTTRNCATKKRAKNSGHLFRPTAAVIIYASTHVCRMRVSLSPGKLACRGLYRATGITKCPTGLLGHGS